MMGISLADNKESIKVMERCGFIKLHEGVGKYQGENREIRKYVCFLPPKDIVTKFFEDGYTNRNYDFVMTCMGVPATGKHITFEALENFKDSPSS